MNQNSKIVTTTKVKTNIGSLLILIASLIIAAWIGYVGTTLLIGN